MSKKPARPLSRRVMDAAPKARETRVIVGGSLAELPPAIREAMRRELQTLDAQSPVVTLGSSTGKTAPPPEARGTVIARRFEALLGELVGYHVDIEAGIRRLGGAWPSPGEASKSATIGDVNVDNFQDALELRLDGLAREVEHARVLRDRLTDIV